MAVKYTSYDDVYKAYAWRDNRRRLVVTQGEGLSSSSTDSNTYIKTAKFQLRDEQGVIELPNSTTAVSLALKKQNDMEVLVSAFYNYTDSATTKSEDRENGIVYFAITQSMTDIAGEVSGEIRLTTSTGVIKFYGINFYVYDGVSSNAAIQSNDFDHLVNALNKVEAVTGGGTIATMDSVIEHGGLHPVVSGVIYDFVNGNYRQISYAHETNSASYGDGGVYIDNATDVKKMYYLCNSNDAIIGIILSVFPPGYAYGMQIRIGYGGQISLRKKTQESGESSYTWKDWHPIGSTQNIQDGAVTTCKIDSKAVTRAKIADGAVDTAQLAYAAVTTDNIDSNAVGTDEMADGAVTTSKLAASAVTTAKVANGSITPEKLSKAYVDHAPEIFIGTTDKTTTENGTSTKQYSELDRYINKYNGKIWVCTNATQVSDAWVYTWSEKGNFYNYPAQVSYPLNKNAWSNNQIELSGQLWAVADGRKRVDVDIDQATYLQLCADGCAGLFVSTDDSGSTPVFTMNAIGNVPTTDITVQLTLWHVIDL